MNREKNVDKAGVGCYDNEVVACLGRGAPFLRRIFEGAGKEVRAMDALRSARRKVVGTKQVTRALKAGAAARAYVANDADTFIYQQVVRAAEEAGVPCVRVNTMKELGMVCGVDVSAAAAAVLK